MLTSLIILTKSWRLFTDLTPSVPLFLMRWGGCNNKFIDFFIASKYTILNLPLLHVEKGVRR